MKLNPLALVFAISFSLHAADNGWIPVTGVVLDPVHQSLRSIQGLPGASLLGPALDLPFAVGQASILGTKNAAIAIEVGIDADHAGQAWLVTGLLTGSPAASSLEGTIAGADRIATNRAGSAAVLYAKSASQLQFLRGLPGNASISEPILLDGVYGDVTALAVSDDGSWALIGVTDSGKGAVYRIGPATNNELLLVTTVGDPRAIVLNAHDAVIADYATDEVLLVRDVTGSQDRSVLVNNSGGVSGPVALQLLDDRSVLIANAGSQTIGRVDPATGQMDTIPVGAAPERLEKLSQPNTFALNQPGGAPLLLLDAASEFRVVFVSERAPQ